MQLALLFSVTKWARFLISLIQVTSLDAPLSKKGLTSETQQIIPALVEWIKSIRVINKKGKDITNTFHCLNGLIGTLNTVSQVLDHLRSTAEFKYLLTQRLCSDPLENFFSIIRQSGGYNSNPSLLSFSHAYKAVIFN
jgi:hypothetical protein